MTELLNLINLVIMMWLAKAATIAARSHGATHGGGTWCVARDEANLEDLQTALNYACGVGGADCEPIQLDGACFSPDTVRDHASYAFNSYYQNQGCKRDSCNFNGLARTTIVDPSYESCIYLSNFTGGLSFSGVPSEGSSLLMHGAKGSSVCIYGASLLIGVLLVF